MTAQINEQSFYERHEERRHEDSLSRRDFRNKARGEMNEIRHALERAGDEVLDIILVLQQLRSTRSYGRSISPMPTRPPTRAGASAPIFRRAQVTNYAELAARIGGLPPDIPPTLQRQIRALEACFGNQAMSNLGIIRERFRVGADILNSDRMIISRRPGNRPWPLRHMNVDVMAHAPSDDRNISGYAIHIYDPFFIVSPASINTDNNGSDAWRIRLMLICGHPFNLELKYTSILLHEALHWHFGGGHQQLGDLFNPQNFEFFMHVRYSAHPPSYEELDRFRRRQN